MSMNVRRVLSDVRQYVKIATMKYINVRQLTRSLDEAIKELPVTVTRNGVPIFRIEPLDYEPTYKTIEEAIKPEVFSKDFLNASPRDFLDKMSKPKLDGVELATHLVQNPVTTNEAAGTPSEYIKCLAPNAHCKAPARYLMTFENPETFEVESLPFCEVHANWLRKNYEIIREEDALS